MERESLTGEHTRSAKALTALVRFNALRMDAHKALTGYKLSRGPSGMRGTRTWRSRWPVAEAARLATWIGEIDKQLTANNK